jgi:uncharacterized protein (DUF952 family)
MNAQAPNDSKKPPVTHQLPERLSSDFLYKICPNATWQSIRQAPDWSGSPDDIRDGFVHFSAAHQVAGTLQKHFANQTDLVLLAISAESLGPALKWEPSRGGELFPHLYGRLPLSAVVEVRELSDIGPVTDES